LNNLNSVTVPGAAAGWAKTVKEFGSGNLTLEEVLAPAIRMAREGIPTHEINSKSVSWKLNCYFSQLTGSGSTPSNSSKMLRLIGASESDSFTLGYTRSQCRMMAKHEVSGYTGVSDL